MSHLSPLIRSIKMAFGGPILQNARVFVFKLFPNLEFITHAGFGVALHQAEQLLIYRPQLYLDSALLCPIEGGADKACSEMNLKCK
jgi:hypothetical protein